MKFLKLINTESLLLLAISFLALRYGFLKPAAASLALNDLQFALLLLSVLCIAAGAFFIINLNGKYEGSYSDANTYNIYGGLTLAGFALGYYVAIVTGNSAIVAVLVIPAAVIFLYATSLKQVIVLSNLLEAIFITSAFLVLPVYELYPAITPENQVQMATLFSVMLDFAMFTFALSLVLTFVNNLRDTNHDYNAGNATLAISLGRKRTSRIAFGLMLIPLAMAVYYADAYMLDLLPALAIGLVFILGPMLWFLIKIWDAKTEKDFSVLSRVLKYTIFFASVFIAVLTLFINKNA
jgi:4-hydroxybenzoate polyprenyltransferase